MESFSHFTLRLYPPVYHFLMGILGHNKCQRHLSIKHTDPCQRHDAQILEFKVFPLQPFSIKLGRIIESAKTFNPIFTNGYGTF